MDQTEDIVVRLRKRAMVRRGDGRIPDSVAQAFDEAADEIERLRLLVDQYQWANANVMHQVRSVSSDSAEPFRPGEVVA